MNGINERDISKFYPIIIEKNKIKCDDWVKNKNGNKIKKFISSTIFFYSSFNCFINLSKMKSTSESPSYQKRADRVMRFEGNGNKRKHPYETFVRLLHSFYAMLIGIEYFPNITIFILLFFYNCLE